MQTTVLQQYKMQALETLTKGEIVVKLFEEASKQIKTAIFLSKRQDNVRAYNCIAKSQKIISTLRSSLDMRVPISLQLSELYSFISEQIGKAIVDKDEDTLKVMSEMLDDLKLTFKQADIVSRTNVACK